MMGRQFQLSDLSSKGRLSPWGRWRASCCWRYGSRGGETMCYRDILVRIPALARRLIHLLSKLLERVVLAWPCDGTGHASMNGTPSLAQGAPSPGNELLPKVPSTLRVCALTRPSPGGNRLRVSSVHLLVLIRWSRSWLGSSRAAGGGRRSVISAEDTL